MNTAEAPERIRLYYDHDAHGWRESRQTNATSGKPEYVLASKLDAIERELAEVHGGPALTRAFRLERNAARDRVAALEAALRAVDAYLAGDQTYEYGVMGPDELTPAKMIRKLITGDSNG